MINRLVELKGRITLWHIMEIIWSRYSDQGARISDHEEGVESIQPSSRGRRV